MRSLIVLILILSPLTAPAEEGIEFFENKIRPVLVENCYECHAAATKQKAGLLLDSKLGWQTGGDSGPALVLGDPDKSLIVKAVSYQEPDLQMPPKKRLKPNEIEDLKKWIAMGAPDPREGDAEAVANASETIDVQARKAAHWAWQPVNQIATDKRIDDFIRAKLEDAGLTPNGPAKPHVLIRRIYFDLIGLPPTLEQVQAFIADPSREAYEGVVAELLRSPHFGERWGQHWLDLVRFAETWGHEQDFAIPEAWRYRDYVIRAFNADVPYDEFLIEHIAGDLVKEPRIDPETRTNQSIQGTGFWHLGEATHSPVDIRGDECTRVANQIDVFSKAFLGLTIACARCHDHKFDAISTKDYYALFGYLQSSNYHLADVSDPHAQAEAANALKQLHTQQSQTVRGQLWRDYFLARAEDRLDLDRWASSDAAKNPEHPLYPFTVKPDAESFEETRHEILARWLEQAKRGQEAVKNQRIVRTDKKGELNYIPSERRFDPDIDVLAEYSRPEAPWYTAGHRFGLGPVPAGSLLLGDDPKKPLSAIVLEPAAHADHLSERFTGMIRTKTFEVTGDKLWYRFRGKGRAFLAVDSHRVCQGPLHSGRLKLKLEGGDAYRWKAHDVRKYIGHRLHVEFTPESGFSLAEVRFSDREPVKPFAVNEQVAALVKNPHIKSRLDFREAYLLLLDRAVNAFRDGSSQDRDLHALANWLFTELDVLQSPKLLKRHAQFLTAKKDLEDRIPQPVRALTLMDGNGEDEPVHIRGNYRTLSPQPVERGLLEALGTVPAPKDGSGRMELARRVVSPDNPLTSRVMVNRIWHHLFGRGLVATVDNFGETGTPPTHPNLLDYLAGRFTANGWSVKNAIREMVLSNTYRQSSAPSETRSAIDPTNALWHRMPIRRLTGEAIRDHVLAVSGRLNRQAFGKSVMVHISDFMRNNRSPGGSGPLDGDGRRSIYIEGRRNHLDPLLVAFDKPTPFTAIGKRNVSNSAAQPLIMLNSPFVHQQAAEWALRLLRDDQTDEQRIQAAYWSAFGRPPESWEMEAAVAFLTEQRSQYPEDEASKKAWGDLAHTLFNVKEFIFLN